MSTGEVRLLLVDDDPLAIQVMAHMLSEYPDQRFATSGEAALRLAREAAPDLMLLDADMPGMSGIQVCVAMKSEPALARIPIIFATSHDSTEIQVAALRAGAADFVTKPLVAAQLQARVRAQLRTRLTPETLKVDAAAMRTESAVPQQRPRILIVDDDAASIHILHRTLSTMGDMHFAKSGEEALEVAERFVPDLILLDAHMPGLDGFDVCRSLKAKSRFKHVPIAFVTRFSDPRYEMRALDLGAADFIAKPYTAAVLQARMRNLLELKKRTDAELRAVRDHWQRVGEARIADMVAAASDAIVTYDAQDRVVLINVAACRMFHVSHEDAMGSPAHTLLGEFASADASLPGIPALRTMTLLSGKSVAAEASVSSIGDGPTRLTTVMLRDTSDRDHLEAESRSRIAAESASRTKTLMMSYIAHEMGNPLNGLLGFGQLMGEDAVHPLLGEQAERLTHMMASARQLQALMRDVTDLGGFEVGKLAIHSSLIEAGPCVAEATAACSGLAEQAGVVVTSNPIPSTVVAADAGRLQQCMVNLLTNAIKYNRAQGWVRIEVKAEKNHVEFSVRDNGIGMDALQLRHLFEPFNRLGRQREEARGAGLGLAITRQLVKSMKGKLRVDSAVGEGTCFTISLPSALAS